MKGNKTMKTIMKGNLKATLAALYTAYLSVLATPSSVNATNTYDFGADFSGTRNPNGADF